jgi:hypothetical protein
MTGNWMQVFALGWLVVELANRAGVPERAALYAGLVGFARLLPGLRSASSPALSPIESTAVLCWWWRRSPGC